jgi:hypothetical protein
MYLLNLTNECSSLCMFLMPANGLTVCAVAETARLRAVPRTERSEGRGVFALVVRCRIMMLFVYSRVGKNRDSLLLY